MYERRHHPLISRRRFVLRLLGHGLAALGLLLASLLAGMAGYSHYESLPWRDAFLNAAMLLGGMGPVDPPHTPGGKVFEGLFALYAGIMFLFTASIILAPILHRLLHHFHAVDDERPQSSTD
jgi:hypothetical protein